MFFYCTLLGAEPTVLEAPKNTVVTEHEDAAFTCIVIGGPQPEVYWNKGEVFLLLLLFLNLSYPA